MAIQSVPSIPTTMTAIRCQPNNELGISHDTPVSMPEPDQVLVKNVAVALNPCDFKMVSAFPSPGAIDGCDFTGTVVAIGSAVTQDYKIGDRVCGAVHGSNPIDHASGSFGEYLRPTADILLKVPDDVPWPTAAALGGTGTASLGIALWRSLKLKGDPENPIKKPVPVLVYGGSTATGTMALQLLKLSGYIPITTCSPKNNDLVRSYGAAEVFDYNSKTCAADIRAYTKNALSYVLDIIADGPSMRLCYEAIGRAGGRYTGLELIPEGSPHRPTVKSDWVLGFAIFGKEIALDMGYYRKADPELRVFGKAWIEKVQRLLDAGKLKSHPVKLGEGGWEGVMDGLELMRNKQVSGEKLVYYIAKP